MRTSANENEGKYHRANGKDATLRKWEYAKTTKHGYLITAWPTWLENNRVYVFSKSIREYIQINKNSAYTLSYLNYTVLTRCKNHTIDDYEIWFHLRRTLVYKMVILSMKIAIFIGQVTMNNQNLLSRLRHPSICTRLQRIL